MAVDPERAIIAAWHANAAAWTDAVRAGRIASRERVTNEAILTALRALDPASMLDVGCGEGWLVRALAASGAQIVGVDAVPSLVERARAAGGGEFQVMDYLALLTGDLPTPFDAVVCNFSLLGRVSTEAVFTAAPGLLRPGGRFLVQTLHPGLADEAREGWRAGSWDGRGDGFGAPAPWYYRTLAGWHDLFRDHGLRLLETREPADPATGRPVSVLFTAVPA